MRSVSEKIGLNFKYLPDFASYILHNELETFVTDLSEGLKQADVPLLRFFRSIPADQRMAINVATNREMLTLLAANEAEKYISQSISAWLSDQLPKISKEQIHAEDITLINYIRGAVFRKFISSYTGDPVLSQHLIEELHRFAVIFDSEAFASYLELQKAEIQKMNAILQQRERQLLEAQEIGQIGSFEWDLAGNASSVTPQMFKIFETESLRDMSEFLENVHPEDREKLHKAIQKAFADGDFECEYRIVRNNKEKIILSRGKMIIENGKPLKMVGTVADVTERHTIIRKLQQSEVLHKQAQAITHIGNWSWIIQENKIHWSDEMYRIYGLEPKSEEITFERFVSFIHPEDREIRISEIEKALQTAKTEEYHFRINAADGSQKVLGGRGEVKTDSTGKPIVMLGTCQDITREFSLTEKLRERERYLEELNESLRRANSELSRTNEELESFNFIASHDLQEPLRKIQVYSNRILDDGKQELSKSVRDNFERIHTASKGMQKLIEDFLAFSQTFNNNQPPEFTDLNKLVDEIRGELVSRIEESGAQIQAIDLPPIYAIPFHLKQLLINLISNALKYRRPGVPPHVVITGAVVPGSAVPEGAPNVNYTMISIRDNGIGFEPKYNAKIFELFQRLHAKNVYSGTGIGLALCKKIVRNLGGSITAESEPGKGSVFTFYIPKTEEKDQLRE
jgi:PAS domain S-box-containing protein